MMRLEEIRDQWRQIDRKLDQTLLLEIELVRQLVMRPARRRVGRLLVRPGIDVLFCLAGLLLGAKFLSAHGHDWALVVPTAVTMICLVALLADCVRQLVLLKELDWCGPVADIQRALERLRMAKIRQFKWVILFAPLAGFSAFIVGAHWLLELVSDGRVQLIEKFNPLWIAGNYAFGALFVLLGSFVARVLALRCRRQRWWQVLLDDISGSSLNEAAQDLERWASLQQSSSIRSH